MRRLLFRSVLASLSLFFPRLTPSSLIHVCKKKKNLCAVGINGESSFEAALLKRAPGCEVWGYDYSVTSVGVFSCYQSSGPLLI